MVVIYEYRIPLPFTLEEYEIAQLYMVAKYSASESSGDNGDGVEILKNEPFADKDRRGQYTHKIYHLASKLPSWLVSLLPKKALILEEEAWNAYPHCTTILKCPFLNKFKLILDSTHVADRGTSPNALNLDPKSLKKRQVEYIDIAMDQPERYVEEEDPTLFKSTRTGRGPLCEGWQKECEPFMCAYKCDIRRMEHETAEAIRRARAQILSRLQSSEEEDGDPGVLDTEARPAGDSSDFLEGHQERASSNPGTPRLKASPSNRLKELTTSLSKRRASMSLVGPSFSVGINTLSASEVHQSGDSSQGGGSAPPMPTLPEWNSCDKQEGPVSADNPTLPRQIGGSCESFSGAHLNGNEWDVPYYGLEDQSSTEVSKCIDVLDRVIVWTKALRLRKSIKNSAGMVVPVNEKSGEMTPAERNETVPRSSDIVDQYVGVLDSALSVVKRRPSKSKLM
ncbi:hypothetical protein R1sor_005465 [Riccia sorocarpa]|uniref:Phosphatidylinositol transfer protein N-terminal domain-containing protein n=1 Tax=Riccia sorocarpa TaxID=122646 RepID=A0ABD3HNA9_9MARC